MDTHELQTITLDYRQECQHDDVVDSLTSPEIVGDTPLSELHRRTGSAAEAAKNGTQFLHLLRLSLNGLEINRGRTEWRKKPAR